MVKEILRYHPPVDLKGDEWDATALGWALNGSMHGWRRESGDYAAAVEALLQAGANAPPLTENLEASEPVRAILRRHEQRGGDKSSARRC
jgi:hypothetical protein